MRLFKTVQVTLLSWESLDQTKKHLNINFRKTILQKRLKFENFIWSFSLKKEFFLKKIVKNCSKSFETDLNIWRSSILGNGNGLIFLLIVLFFMLQRSTDCIRRVVLFHSCWSQLKIIQQQLSGTKVARGIGIQRHRQLETQVARDIGSQRHRQLETQLAGDKGRQKPR